MQICPPAIAICARQITHWIITFACIGALTSCVVGPDYRRPALPVSAGFAPASLADPTSATDDVRGSAQRFALSRDIQADWWRLFQSEALNRLIDTALRGNPTIEAAQAALRVAQENVYAQQGFFFPTVQASYSPARTKLAGNLGGNSPGVQGNGSVISTTVNPSFSAGGSPPFNGPVLYNFHTAQLTVGYAPDLFGGNRRQVEASLAQENYQRFQLEAAYITLASNVVAAAIQEASLKQQITIMQTMIDAGTKSVELVRRQLKAGYASRLDLALQEAAVAQARQALPPLQKQLALTRDLLRALLGDAQDSALPDTLELAALTLPGTLPLSLPSEVVEQRPDVRAAEEQLRSATALVGVAKANRLPQFTINATAGGAASQFGQMFWDSGKFFSLAANIAQPIFDGGTLRHRQRAAEEGARQAAAQYKSTVITAFQNVADTLHAIQADANALSAASEAKQAAALSLDLIRRQHAKGYVDRIALIGAEQSQRLAELNVTQAHAARLGDTAALFQALGGGWWHRAGSTVPSE